MSPKSESWYERFLADNGYSAKEAFSDPINYGDSESEYARWCDKIECELSDGYADDAAEATEHIAGL